jgi:outer membrane protein
MAFTLHSKKKIKTIMKKIVIFLACALFSGNIVFAQTEPLKIAYINSTSLLSAMPEKAKADSDVAKYAKSFQDQIDIMMKDYQTKGQDYQAKEKTMTEAMKEVKMKEIQDLQNRIESIQQSAQEKLQQKKADAYQPIIDRADKALKEVAKEKNYDFIFDQAAGGVMVFGKEQYDITPIVKAKLGIK